MSSQNNATNKSGQKSSNQNNTSVNNSNLPNKTSSQQQNQASNNNEGANENGEGQQKKFTQPSEQIGHRIVIRVKEATLNLNEDEVTKKTYMRQGLKPFDRENEEKADRQKRIVTKKVDFLTYASLYFGTNINSKQEQKLLIKQLVQKKIDKEIQDRTKLEWDKQRIKMYESLRSNEENQKTMILKDLDETSKPQNPNESKNNINVSQNSANNQSSQSKPQNNSTGQAGNNSQSKPAGSQSKQSASPSKNVTANSKAPGDDQQPQESEQERRLGLTELNKASLQEIGVLNLKNMTKIQNTKIQKGVTPVYDQEFEFQRETENFFTIAIWQRDSDQQQFYKQRLQFLQERYQGDNLIGEARIDFARFFDKKIAGKKDQKEEKPPENTFTKIVDLKLGQEKIGTVEIECTYVPPSKIPEKREVQDELGLMINSVDVNLTTSNKEWEKFKDLVPSLAVRIQSRTKRTTQPVPLAKAMSFKEVISFKKIPQDAVKIYFEIMCTNPVNELQKCAGVSFVEIDDLEELDNLDRTMKKKSFEKDLTDGQKKEVRERFEKLKKKLESLEVRYKGVVCGTLKFDYELIPRVEPKQFKLLTEFKDMKELSRPDKFERQKQKHLQLRHKLMKQKLWKEIEPHKATVEIRPEPIELQYNTKTKQLLSSSATNIQIRQTDKAYLEKVSKNGGEPPQQQQQPSQTPAELRYVKPVKVYANVKEIIKIHLPKISTTTPSGQIKAGKTVTPNIFVKVLKDQNYNHSVYGNGLSVQQSASTLRYSVPDFSLPKGARFDNPDNKLPGPNAYQRDGVGMLQSTLDVDQKLKKRREKLRAYEEKRTGKSPNRQGSPQKQTTTNTNPTSTNPTNTKPTTTNPNKTSTNPSTTFPNKTGSNK